MPMYSYAFDSTGVSLYLDGREVIRASRAEQPPPPGPFYRRPRQGQAIGKVERAKRHLRELDDLLGEYVQTAFTLHEEVDNSTSEIVLRVERGAPVPEDAGLIVGEIAHNLRSPLNHLVARMILQTGGQPTKRTDFLISSSLQSYSHSEAAVLQGVPDKGKRFLRRLRPYQGGNEVLWHLSQMNNHDKHKADLVAVAKLRAALRLGMPGIFQGADGGVYLGGGPQGAIPFGMDAYLLPENARAVQLMGPSTELMRLSTAIDQFPHEVGAHIFVGLGEDATTDIVRVAARTIDMVENILKAADSLGL